MALSKFQMLKEYFKNYKKMGAILPDSKSCVETLVGRVDFKNAKVVVEWGGGSGTVSRKILEKLAPDARLFTFEANPNFHANLETISDKRFTLVKDLLQDTPAVMNRFGVTHVDAVVSTVPSSQIDEFGSLVQKVLGNLLRPEGVFVQYMHITAYLKGYFLKQVLAARFKRVHPDFVWMNVPPTLVCSASGIIPPSVLPPTSPA